jgi:hypothetical protein
MALRRFVSIFSQFANWIRKSTIPITIFVCLVYSEDNFFSTIMLISFEIYFKFELLS